MSHIVYYVLISASIFFTIAALPVGVSNKKDSKFCCECTVEDKKTTETVTGLGTGIISTINVLTPSLRGCGGLTPAVTGGTGGGFISTGGAGLINTYIGGLGTGFMMPSVQIPAPQMQIIPRQQHLLYNLQTMQLPFFNMQQSKVSTQCCMPCPDGSGFCCCSPGATTTVPRDSGSLPPPHYPAGAGIPIKNTSLLVSIITMLALENIF
ncbi:hypothetical protein X798_03378 [Onchocerca flexuosa]|uniref:Secreted protein n=2 Tax=Onchocerca flexuosa TaxID=387005 RepID=A0A183HYZ9_9BILA|nr:hypothetical protein X798_03378 [Onchocerca flexuosa]VDP11976.1 unnamed protein product [Onchocerca flexuosa]